MKSRRIWWWGGAAVIAIAAFAWWLRPRPIAADTVLVRRGTLHVTVGDEGTTRVVDRKNVNAPASGRFVPRGLVAGDSVERGALLGKIEPAPLDPRQRDQAVADEGAAASAVHEAESQLGAAQTSLDDAERSLARLERLLAAGAVAPEEVDRARTAARTRRDARDAGKSRLDAARFVLAGARAAMNGARTAVPMDVRAPVRGAVLRVFEEHERVVPAGTPLVQVGDPSRLEIVVPLLTADAALVRPGAPMRVVAGSRADTLDARVTIVEPGAFTKLSPLGVEEQRVNIIGKLVTGTARLGDAYHVDARIIVAEARDVVLVPVSALVHHDAEWSVWIVQNGRARHRIVTLGAQGDGVAEVRAGLAPGDRVIAWPGDLVKEGVRVRE